MTDHAVRPESTLSLAFQIEQQIHAIGDQARIAVDQMFQQLAEAGWYWRSRYDEDTMPVHVDIGERLEYQAGLVIGEQLSNAILAYWVHLRRGSQVEWGTEESLGTLFSGLAGIVAELIFRAMPDPDLGELVGPAAMSAEQVSV